MLYGLICSSVKEPYVGSIGNCNLMAHDLETYVQFGKSIK
jgi:hypothetical protein